MQRRKRGKLTRADLERANVGEKFFKVTLDQISAEFPHHRVLDNYVAGIDGHLSDGMGLLLYGDHDFGKTAAAVIVLKAALLAGFTALFVEAARLQALAIERRRFDEETTWIERAETVDLLVLDDLGLDHGRDFAHVVIESLFRARANRSRATIVTTNLGERDTDGLLAAIAEKYGGGVRGVLRESCFPVRVKGKNWRAEKADMLAQRLGAKPKKVV